MNTLRWTDPQRDPDQHRRFLLAVAAAQDEAKQRAAAADSKTLPFTATVPNNTGTGEFEGLASVYDVVDTQQDVVVRGAFRNTLQAQSRVPILWQHDPMQLLGVADLEDTPQGLKVRGRLNLAVAKAKEVYELLKQGALRGLSIGYRTITAASRGKVRELRDVQLFEVSLTPFPAQPLATVSAVKGRDDPALAALPAQVRLIRLDARARLLDRMTTTHKGGRI